MKSFLKKNILLAIFLDVFAFVFLFLMFSTAHSLLNYDPQTHINIKNPVYNFFIDLFLLFTSQITSIRFINSKLLKTKNEIVIVHLVFLGLVIVLLFISFIPSWIQRTECLRIISSPVYRNTNNEANQCLTFMENSGMGLAAIIFIDLPAIVFFTFISLYLNILLMNSANEKRSNKLALLRMLIFVYPLYVILRTLFFLTKSLNRFS